MNALAPSQPIKLAPAEMIGYLTQVAASPVGAAIKERAHGLLRLQAGDAVVDVGCGPGVDTAALARLVGPSGQAIGIDNEPEMVLHARELSRQSGVGAWTTFQVGSAVALPLPDAAVNGWYSERVLQHLPGAQPTKALLEAKRVLARGGRLVVVDSDWGTLSIASRQLAIERRLVGLHASRLASGFVGRMLPRLVHEAGLTRTSVECFSAMLNPASLDFVLGPTERVALATGLITPLEHELWRNDLAQLRATGDGLATLTITLVCGVRP
jgi:SAM-dependent methyltransferase